MNHNDVLSKTKKYIPIPENTQSIMDCLRSNDFNIKVLSQLIEKDASLCVNILRVANSPFYGFSRDINSTRDAIIVMGKNTVQNLILSLSINESIKNTNYGIFPAQEMWQHSLCVACFSRTFSGLLKENEDNAYILGLFHNIGSYALAWSFPNEYNKVLNKVFDKNMSYSDAEKEIFNISFEHVGASLVQQWKMPEAINSAIKRQSEPDTNKNKLVMCLKLSKLASISCYQRINLYPALPIICEKSITDINLTKNDIIERLISGKKYYSSLMTSL